MSVTERNKSMKTENIKARFARTHETFRSNIEKLAAAAKQDVMEIYAMWLVYVKDCDAWDQSPLVWEFTAVLGKQVGINRNELLAVITQ